MAGSFSPGRPDTDTARWRNRMAQLFKKVFTDDDVIEVMEHLKDQAVNSNDIQWTALFLAYAVGKPTSNDEALASRFQLDGDINIQINQLSSDELRVLKNLNVYDTIAPDTLEGATPQAS